MPRYVQIDQNSVAIGFSDLSAEVEAPHMIRIGDGDDFTGWTYVDGGWAYPPLLHEETQPVENISDRQFFQALAVRGEITEAEALDAVGPGIIPPAMDALIDQLPQEQRFAARMLIRGATRYERQHPIADLIRSLYGWSIEDADDFWRFAATL